jgi:Trypsin-like peptidase domain
MKALIIFLHLLLFVYEGTAVADAQCPSATLAAENMTVLVNGRYVTGAGVIMAIRGTNIYIATAKHVIDAESSFAFFTVRFRSEEKIKVSVKAIHKSPKKDLTFLVTENRELAERLQQQLSWQILRPRSAPKLSAGPDRAIIVGQQGAGEWAKSLEPERISYNRKEDLIDIQSTTIQTGFSGGGVFDPSGSLIGVIINDDGHLGHAIPIETALDEALRLGLPVDLRENGLTPVPVFIAPLTGAQDDWDQLIRANIREKLEMQLGRRGFRLLDCESASRATSIFGSVRMIHPTLATDVAIVTWKFNYLNGPASSPEPQHLEFYRWFGTLSEHVDEVGEYAVMNFMKELPRFDTQ